MKVPAEYITGKMIGKDEYMPMPMFEKIQKIQTFNYIINMDRPTFGGVFRMNPELNFGVYSKDLGGFVENPNWTPVPEFLGYTFNKYAAQFLYNHNERDVVYLHCRQFHTKDEIAKFENDLGGEIFINHKTDNVIDMYMDKYGKDIPNERHQIEEKTILDKFNQNWDITTGLTPGDHERDVREF